MREMLLGSNTDRGAMQTRGEMQLGEMQKGEKCRRRSNATGEKCSFHQSRQEQLLSGWGEMNTGEKFRRGGNADGEEMQLLSKQTVAIIGIKGRNAAGEECNTTKADRSSYCQTGEKCHQTLVISNRKVFGYNNMQCNILGP